MLIKPDEQLNKCEAIIAGYVSQEKEEIRQKEAEKITNVLSSESRNRTCSDYAESRKTTNEIEKVLYNNLFVENFNRILNRR